ncbi:MAG: amidase signature domain-containing protein [Piptocephalis tieghemiana]|nr:MAG: amidase signature domain-containing protein [Piptocephalis tieghemiana]
MRLLFSVRTLFRGGEEAGFRIPRQALTTQVTARTREAQASLERIARKDQETRAFLSLEPQDKVLKRVASSLAQEPSSTAAIPPHDLTGRLLAVKDNICIQGLPTTCSSNALHAWVSPMTATVVQRLESAGCVVVGKTSMDEFGMGSAGLFTPRGPTQNPQTPRAGDKEIRVAGGSSSGSAAAVASGMAWAALGTDTGGSVRLPAAYCGVIGFKPTYGRISRYGVIAYASSLDTVGILAQSVQDVRDVYANAEAWDEKDMTSIPTSIRSKIRSSWEIDHAKGGKKSQACDGKILKGLRIGIPKEYRVTELSQQALEAWERAARELESLGATLTSVSCPTTHLALPCYYVLAPAEASSNLARYDGYRYGQGREKNEENEEEGMTEWSRRPIPRESYRESNLGEEVRRRILLGTFALSDGAREAYYGKALRVRRLIQRDFNRVFLDPHPITPSDQHGCSMEKGEGERVHLLLTPSSISSAPTLTEALNPTSAASAYVNDVMTVPASLAGLPAISLPCGKDEPTAMPLGIQLLGQWGQDDLVLRVSEALMERFSSSSSSG